MSYHHRDRKKRLSGFRSIYGDGSIQSGTLRIEPVHLIPDQIQTGEEFDFWFHNGKDLYLVTLERSKHSRIHYLRATPRSQLYIRLQLDIGCLPPDKIIEIFEWINQFNLPGPRKIRQSRQISSPLSN